MESERTTCPNCGATQPQGAIFCESCGKRVDRACESSAAVSSSPCGSERRPAALQGTPADAAPFEVSAALPEAMQVGRRSLVHVRFRARADIYESVVFVLRNGDDELARVPCCNGRPFAVEHQVSLPVTPKVCGAARVALDVLCRVGLGCDEEIHTVSLDVAVDDRKSQAAFSPVFNISQNQTSDRAGDTNGGDVNVNLGGLKITVDENSARYETPVKFLPLCMTLRKSPTRLTLKEGAGVLQLLSDDVVSFGRNRDNVVPLRIFGPSGEIDENASKGISRFHFRLSRTDRDCLVMDGGRPPAQDGEGVVSPSAYGTRIDGKSVPAAGGCRIESDRDVVLGVGREDVELKLRLRFVRDGWGRPSGVMINREDGADVRICTVWREVSVSAAEKIIWNGSHWAMMSGSGELRPIVIGAAVSIGGRHFQVQPFHKTHLN